MCRPTPASRAVAVSPAMAGGSGTSWPCTTSPANRAISPSSRLAATAPGTAPAPPPGRGPASAQASATTLQQASTCSATYVPQPTALTVITTARSIGGSPSSRPAATAATCWTFNADPVPAGPPWLSGRCGAAQGRTSRAVLRRPSRPTATVASSHGSSQARPGARGEPRAHGHLTGQRAHPGQPALERVGTELAADPAGQAATAQGRAARQRGHRGPGTEPHRRAQAAGQGDAGQRVAGQGTTGRPASHAARQHHHGRGHRHVLSRYLLREPMQCNPGHLATQPGNYEASYPPAVLYTITLRNNRITTHREGVRLSVHFLAPRRAAAHPPGTRGRPGPSPPSPHCSPECQHHQHHRPH